MAIFKYAERAYMSPKDLSNLIYYVTNPHKCLLIQSNMLYSNDYNLIIAQWLYYHQCYHKLNQNLAFQYILSFNAQSEKEMLNPFMHTTIMRDICNLKCFNDVNIFTSLHKPDSSRAEHIHIIVDTINKKTGNQLFVPRHDLISQIGRILEPHRISLIGYNDYINSHRTPQHQNAYPALIRFAV